jgi:hypothetical protein
VGFVHAQPRVDSTPQCVNGMRGRFRAEVTGPLIITYCYSYPSVECGMAGLVFEGTESRTGDSVLLELSFRITGFLDIVRLPVGAGIASRYSNWLRAGRSGGRSSSPGRVKNCLFSTSSRLALGPTQPPIQWVPGALSSGVKWPGREADHSPPASTAVKKMWIYAFTPPYAFMA